MIGLEQQSGGKLLPLTTGENANYGLKRGHYFLEYFQDKKKEWRWRFGYQIGQRRRIMSESSEGYKRRVNAEHAWHSTRNREFTVSIIRPPQSARKNTAKRSAGH
jgi:uncharacterized protein YegP (UPF0339 family)